MLSTEPTTTHTTKPSSQQSSQYAYAKLKPHEVIQALTRNLPLRLRSLKSFVVFRFAPPKKQGGKPNKVPYYAKPGTPRKRFGVQGSPEDIACMASYGEACTFYKTSKLAVSGIGVCALPHNPYSFVDVDNCIDLETGELNPLAEELIRWTTYTEISPSGRGLRMLVMPNLQLDLKNNEIGLELFSCKGFVTVTGNVFSDTPNPVVRLSEEQVNRLHELMDYHAEQKKAEQDLDSLPIPLMGARIASVRAALKTIDPDISYPDWILIGQALHSGNPNIAGTGFRFWVQWSKQGSKFDGTSEDEMGYKWNGFKATGGVTLASVFHIAKRYGYASGPEEDIGNLAVDIFHDTSRIPEKLLDPVCPGLFDHVGAYMFIGRAKIGKSRILGLLSAAALVGGEVFSYKFKDKCKTLVLALEESMQDVADRLKLYMVDPADHTGDLGFIDHEMFMAAAKKYGQDYSYIQWLDAAVGKFKPRFVYLDPLVNMRMVWSMAPTLNSKRITDEDYQTAAAIQAIAVKHACVIVFTVHGNKRKSIAQGSSFDPFESVGTTSWMAAGCSGSLVIMDKPNYNPLEDDDDGQRVFSIRGRYRTTGDEHLLLQQGKHGTISSLGTYRNVIGTIRQHEMLEVISGLMAEGQEWITGATIARSLGVSIRNVRSVLSRAQVARIHFEGRVIVASRHNGYRLVEVPDERS